MQGFHINTPLLESDILAQKTGLPAVYLKMDNMQPAGSFKTRGIGNFCCKAVRERGCTRLISSSGGNAGYAVAYSGKKLGVPVTVVVPESAPSLIVEKLRMLGAEVIVHGAMWDLAHQKALQLASQEGCALAHPFEHPDIWEGHSTIITESFAQLGASKKPSAVICSVGGGGLLIGVLQGLQNIGWTDVPVIAAETRGADSFAQSVAAGKLVTLPGITSIAKTLGAATVSSEAFEWTKKHKIIPCVVEDSEAVSACLKFLDDQRSMVEPACGASLAVLYGGHTTRLFPSTDLSNGVLVIVCGGNIVDLSLLEQWKKQFNL